MSFQNNADNSRSKSEHAFSLLSPTMRKWVASQGWTSLRDIQSETIEALLSPDPAYRNAVVSAGTASGKTEAAFLPALSLIEKDMQAHPNRRRVQMVYVAPLKALINDQHRRMSAMARDLQIPVVLWHGDAPQSGKTQMMKEHSGILMITPESLESLLMRKGEWCARYLLPLIVVADEFHSFIGDARGKQLLSLLHRIDCLCDFAKAPRARRIGLSATLSQLDRVAEVLCGGDASKCAVIDGRRYGADESLITVETFQPAPPRQDGQRRDERDHEAMARLIVEESGNDKTLTFARSRKEVEDVAAAINRVCEATGSRSQAFPHHGSLSKETREALERRLVGTDKPTMAVATVTLELGIDIGDISTVFQIDSTNTVASLRQRMGRSGRRDGRRRLECLVGLSASEADMHRELASTIAEIELMERGWFEPPETRRKDVSVLVSEILSVLVQYGSAYDDEIRSLLCDRGGAFANVSAELFSLVVADLLSCGFLARDADGTLLIGDAGEKEVSDWRFYATFQSDEAYSVRSGSKRIGEISPPDSALRQLAEGGSFLLGGKAWQVKSVDFNAKTVEVVPSSAKASFLIPVSRGRGDVSGRVKRERIALLNGKRSDYVPDYLDEQGKEALAEARGYARQHLLNGLGVMISAGGGADSHESPSEHARRCAAGYSEDAEVSCFPPVEPATSNAISKMLEAAGMEPGGLDRLPMWRLADLVEACIANAKAISANRENLIDAAMVADLRGREKYNGLLSDETLRCAYAEELMDVEGALEWLEAFSRFHDLVLSGRIGRDGNATSGGEGESGESVMQARSTDMASFREKPKTMRLKKTETR